MSIKEILIVATLQLLLQAAAKYAKTVSAVLVDPVAKAQLAVAAELATDLATLAGMGLVAAQSEFTATQTAQAKLATDLATIPPIV